MIEADNSRRGYVRRSELTHCPALSLPLMPSYRPRLVGPTHQLFPNGCPVPLQVSRQLVHGHPVNARAPIVGLHSLQRFNQVLSLYYFLHQLPVSSRAFGFSLHHGRYGPFLPVKASFTCPGEPKGQLVLVFLPFPAHEVRVLMTTPIRSGLRRLRDYYALC